MAWLWVDTEGNEIISKDEPTDEWNENWLSRYIMEEDDGCIVLPTGSIEKLIGKKMTVNDDAVELKK